VNVGKLTTKLFKLTLDKREAPVMCTQFMQSPSSRSWIKIKPVV